MAFENLTFFELHLHMDDEEDETAPLPRDTSEAEPTTDRRIQGAKILALVGASIAVSVITTIAVRRAAERVKGFRSKDTESTESETVVEITE